MGMERKGGVYDVEYGEREKKEICSFTLFLHFGM